MTTIQIGQYISAIINTMSSCVAFMRSIRINYGNFSVSLWDLEIAFLILSLVLMIALPHFGSDD